MRHAGGSVEVDGRDMPIADSDAMDEFRYHSISVVPQYAMSAMNPTRKTGVMSKELIESRGIKHDTVKDEYEKRLKMVGLRDGVLDLYPMELSGGMKQRVAMVLSTVLNPSLLIADEITSALDVSTQKAVAESLVGLRDNEFVKSMIVITHDLSILHEIADTIMIMYAGHLAEKASTEIIINGPRHPYTRMLIDSLPEVGVRFEDKRLEGIPGKPPSLLDPPTGCRFRDRCPLADDECLERPPFVEIDDGHQVACWKVK
jgi:peptide/nickel transport system ATP-binding protein